MSRRLGLLVAILAALALPATADAKLIGQGSGSGFASASGNVKHPRLLRVQLAASGTSSPLQVDVSYGVSCNGRDFAFDFRDGTFNAYTPFVRRLPRPLKRPTKCRVSVSASQTDFTSTYVLSIFLLAK